MTKSNGNHGRPKKSFEVGYGKPPKATRFEKGRSGNPGGRPRKKKAPPPEMLHDSQSDEILRRELDRLISVTDRNGTRKLTIAEAIRIAQINAALKGSPIAQRHILDSARKLEAREAAKAAAAAEQEKLFIQKLLKLRKIQEDKWAAAEREGREEPDKPWPHPEDILVDEGKMTWSIRGPLTEEDVPLFQYYEALRDQYMLMWELALRRPAKAGDQLAIFWYLNACFYDFLLPLSWQVGDREEIVQMKLSFTDTRSLRRLLREREEDVRYWHRILYPAGERIEFDRETAKLLRPHIKALGYRSIRDYERYLEQQSGNPPNPLIEATRKRLEDRGAGPSG